LVTSPQGKETENEQAGVITMRWMILPLVAAAFLAAQFPALAQPVAGDAASGREIATKRCSSCHRVLPMTLADKADPPSFQSLADLPSTTGISLNAFLHSNHENMPDFIISSADSNDLIAYILSLKKH
jgi:mono/diheme cytochrome c family protein